jgi:nucleoside-diphosphate kinase
MERTLLLFKPDAVQRGLVGRLLARFEEKGLRLVGLKMLQFDRSWAEQLYAVHRDKEFFEPLIAFITSSPCVAVALEGPQAIAVVRKLVGATAGTEASPGTIRGDFALSTRLNLVHASDTPANAARELALIFQPAELFDYKLDRLDWIDPQN